MNAPRGKQPWNDETVMPFGKHNGTKLKDVPASYLLWLFEQPWIKDWPGLYAYLKKNEDLLMSEKRASSKDDDGPDDGGSSFEDYKNYR